MRRLWITLAISCLAASSAHASSPTADAIDGPVVTAGGRADLPELRHWAAAGPAGTDTWCTGLGWHAGFFWVCGSDYDGDQVNESGDNGVYLYDEAGHYFGGFPQPTQDEWGWCDSAYDGDHLMFGASGPHAGTVFWVNANTMVVEHQFTGCPTASTCRALLIEQSVAGVVRYKVSDFGAPIDTYEWTIGSGSATQVGSCPNPSTVSYGLAYDTGNHTIWMTTAGGTYEIYQLDPATCAVQTVWNMGPEMADMGGACVAQTSLGCSLWTLCQCDPTDMVYGWLTYSMHPFACSPVPVEPTTWGSLKARYKD